MGKFQRQLRNLGSKFVGAAKRTGGFLKNTVAPVAKTVGEHAVGALKQVGTAVGNNLKNHAAQYATAALIAGAPVGL